MANPAAALIITNLLLTIASIFLLSSGFYIILLLASKKMLKKERLNWPYLDYNHPSISLVVPAFNEEKDILESVQSMLNQNYRHYEVILVNDGSTDNTLQTVLDAYPCEMIPVDKQIFKLCKTEIRGVYKSLKHNFYIIDKENGKKADALNAGIDFSHHDFICSVDADSIIEPQAFNRVMQEFISNPNMVACGAAIRVVNGTEVSEGVVRRVQLPNSYIELCQLIEYTQTFFMGRIGWQKFNATMIISGAFGMFKKEALLEVGGFDRFSVGEDMDLVVRMHKHFAKKKVDYMIGFIPDPLCWTEVPSTLSSLASQRNRWQRGLLGSIFNVRPIFFNTTKSAFSRLAIPYYILTEVVGPIIEILSYILIIAGLILGFLSWKIVLLFFIISVLFSVMISIAVLIHEEKLFSKEFTLMQAVNLMIGSVLINLGYRQFIVWQRFIGFIDFILQKNDWGAIERKGFLLSRRQKKDTKIKESKV